MKKSFLERITRCNQLKYKEHKDLYWLLSSESISKSLAPINHFDLIDNQHLDELFKKLQVNPNPHLYDPKARLGKYVEKLIKYFLDQLSSHILLESQIQLIENKRTVGELDFLIQSDQQLIHLEFAVKYYLEIKKEKTEYWGPSFKDNWSRKKEHLLHKQMKLSADFNYLLPDIYKGKYFNQRVSVLGKIFKAIEHNSESWYCYANEIDQLNEKGSYFKKVDRRLDWVFPFESPDNYLSFDEIKNKIEKEENRPSMIVIFDQKKAPSSWGFIL